MRVRCVKQNASSFPNEYFTVGFTPESEFNLKVENDYTVYSISLWSGIFSYLIIGERSEWPDWYPAEAFKIVENTVPATWFVSYFRTEEKNGLTLMVGYDEMVNSIDEHHDALIDDREAKALEIFFKRKSEIDKSF